MKLNVSVCGGLLSAAPGSFSLGDPNSGTPLDRGGNLTMLEFSVFGVSVFSCDDLDLPA